MGYIEETGMYEGYIYKIYKIDFPSKVYIGQTSRSINERWREHKKSKDGAYIHKAIRKYGYWNFKIEQIDIVSEYSLENLLDSLNKKEKYWIEYYNSYSDGYNLTIGGDSGVEKNKKSVDVYDIDGNYIDSYESYSFVANIYGLSYQSVSNFANNKTVFPYKKCKDGNYYIFVNRGDKPPSVCKENIYCFDCKGNFINSFFNVNEAVEYMVECEYKGIKKEIIRNGINTSKRMHKPYKGFLWSNDKNINISKYIECEDKVVQYDKNTKEILGVYKTFKEASINVFGNKSYEAHISKCCNGKAYECGGYLWSYIGDFDNINRVRAKSSICTPINVYDKNNNYICNFESQADACRALGVTSSNIQSVLKGRQLSSKGFIFRYAI